MNKLNLTELVERVEQSFIERDQKTATVIKKRVERMEEYAKQHGLKNVPRIPVYPTIEKQEVQGKYGVESVKVYTCTDENIITSIKAIHPDHVNNRLYWYGHERYMFTTDQGNIYNLRQLPRALTKEEHQTIADLKSELEIEKAEVEAMLHRAKILVATLTPVERRTPEQEQMATSGEAVLLYMELDKDIQKARQHCVYGENKDLNMWGETAIYSVVKWEVKHIEKLKNEFLQKAEKNLDKVTAIKERCENEPVFFIHPMASNNKQIKIYIPKFRTCVYEHKGYTIHETKQKNTSTYDVLEHGSIVTVTREHNRTSFYFNMHTEAFKSCCYYGKGAVCNKGYMYTPNGDLVKIERRPKEDVTIMDEQGNIRTFTSKGEAAKELGVSPSMISKAIKNAKGGTPVINKAKTKQLKLMAADYTILSFNSMTEAGKEFNTNKMAISRILKGKKTGDVVTINNTCYTLLE